MSGILNRRLRVAVAIVLVLSLVFVAYRLTLHWLIQRELAEIHRDGYPINLKELATYYPDLPPEQNAANYYQRAFDLYRNWDDQSDTRKLLPIVGEIEMAKQKFPLSATSKELVGRFLMDNAQTLELLHEAGRWQACRYPIDLSKGVEMRLPHLQKLRQGVRLLCLEALWSADRGDSVACVAALRSSLAATASLGNEPNRISQLVRVACLRITVSTLERVVGAGVFEDDQLAALTKLCAEVQKEDGFKRAWVGDQCAIIDAFGRPVNFFSADPNGCDPLTQPVVRFLKVTGLWDVNLLKYLQLVHRCLRISETPFPQRLAGSKMIDEEVHQLSVLNGLASISLQSNSSDTEKFAKGVGTMRIAMSALSIERYRLANNNLPSKLDDLLPKLFEVLPSDPFTGQPLRYKKLAKGYVVYSVGEDGVDDGGDEKKDITFVVER